MLEASYSPVRYTKNPNTPFFRLGTKRKKVFYFAVMDTAHVAVVATAKHDKNHPIVLIHYKVFIRKCFKVSSSNISSLPVNPNQTYGIFI